MFEEDVSHFVSLCVDVVVVVDVVVAATAAASHPSVISFVLLIFGRAHSAVRA